MDDLDAWLADPEVPLVDGHAVQPTHLPFPFDAIRTALGQSSSPVRTGCEDAWAGLPAGSFPAICRFVRERTGSVTHLLIIHHEVSEVMVQSGGMAAPKVTTSSLFREQWISPLDLDDHVIMVYVPDNSQHALAVPVDDSGVLQAMTLRRALPRLLQLRVKLGAWVVALAHTWWDLVKVNAPLSRKDYENEIYQAWVRQERVWEQRALGGRPIERPCAWTYRCCHPWRSFHTARHRGLQCLVRTAWCRSY